MTRAVASMPATLLYWGHLPVPAAGGGDSDAARFRFERFLPLPVDDLHVTSARLSDGSTLIVGIEPQRLRTYLATRADMSPQTWELVPSEVPAHLSALPGLTSAVCRLNLLHGEFEPAPRRRLRRVTAWLAQVALALIAIAVVIGVERRHQAALDYVVAQRQATATALAAVVPPTVGGMKPESRLTMEVRRLEQAARDPAASTSDVTQVLQALWRVWPREVRTQIDTVGANPDRLVIRGRVPGLADAERLATACAGLELPAQGVRAQPLQAQQDDRGASFLLTLVATAEGTRP